MKRPYPCSPVAVLACASLLLAPPIARADLIGHWSLDEGAGNTAADSSGAGNDAALMGGFAWNTDAERGTFITFNGSDSYAEVSGTPLPLFDLVQDFTWAFWSNNNEGVGTRPNAVAFGNRYQPGGGDFDPRQFVKFTPTQFEWHMNGNGNDNVNIPDMVIGEWRHHAVVKDGDSLTYYLDGVATGDSGTITQALDQVQPLFFGGDPGGGAGEYFNGSLDDLRIYDNALSAAQVAGLVPEPSTYALFAGLLALSGAAVHRRRRGR